MIEKIMEIATELAFEIWHILLDSSFYILLGITIAGILKVFLNPNSVLQHLGRGRFSSVAKAAFLGVPLPL
jgi:uncharacterized membrane protein YraQ (UPF0718 family)